jgi:FkbM family methyltransferase
MIFDIGANRGLFTDVCLQKNSNEKIIIVEANPKLSNYLKQKYLNNNNIIVLNILISNIITDLAPFYLSNADTISTASTDWITKSRFTGEYVWYEPIFLPSKTLDSLISEYGVPELIKVDVEGYEYEVLSGLTSKANEICFEWAEEQQDNINKTCEHLQNIGYSDFGYIEGDEYMKKPDVYTKWKENSIHSLMDKDRKDKWGMIWVK